MYAVTYDSPVGKLLLTCSDRGLTGIYMNREAMDRQDTHPILHRAAEWLDAYFRNENPVVDLPLEPKGTPFQKMVWKLLLEIPYGTIRTYGDLSREIACLTGKEKMSAQAVGQAVGRNPISILVPCHRVVGAGGQLTGYAGGLDIKIRLLCHEGRQIENNTVR